MAASPRVALFTGNYNHIADGVSRTLNRAVAFLDAERVPTLVFGPTVDSPPVEHAGELVAVRSIPAPGRPEYRVSLGLDRTARRRLAAFAPTLVHIATPDVLGVRARAWAMRHDVPLVATYHTHFASYLDYYRFGRAEGALWRYLRWFYAPFRHIYVPSASMEAVLREQRVGRPEALRRWARGVETERFHPRRRSAAWRAEHGIGEGEMAVAFVSRLVWEKGLDVYAEVVNRLTAEGKPVRALVVGDGPARAELAARLPETAVFTGHLEGDALPTAYASADVFVFPSDTETFGNVTLEAMASGLPAVCAAAPGASDLVADGETGFLAPARDVAAFTAHTDRLVADAALRARLGRAARTAAERYDWSVVLNQLLHHYHDALDSDPLR